jgi:hypothetical protein
MVKELASQPKTLTKEHEPVSNKEGRMPVKIAARFLMKRSTRANHHTTLYIQEMA